MNPEAHKKYLGDGAYVQHDGYRIILTAENGIRATDRIVFEPEVLRAFLKYVECLRERETCADFYCPLCAGKPARLKEPESQVEPYDFMAGNV